MYLESKVLFMTVTIISFRKYNKFLSFWTIPTK